MVDSFLLDLKKKTFKTLNPEQSLNREASFKQLLFYLKKIKEYGDKKGVMPLIETVPKYSPSDFENLEKGKQFTGITSKKAIMSFFDDMKKALGKDKFNEQLRKIIELVERENINCKISEEAFPYYMLITKNFVLLCFNMPEDITGLLVRDDRVAKQFIDFFESVYKNAKPILPFLKKMKTS